ncbi:unnamed protein product [Prorocentrum cordatum]|uniref:Uncharacterized protein n=1 Tax=Prorocentrum cordatum TaxID=2364126 RepID=A0ABN9SVG6_9DINO|nr:unnamed protein product [Polarella glacialis]
MAMARLPGALGRHVAALLPWAGAPGPSAAAAWQAAPAVGATALATALAAAVLRRWVWRRYLPCKLRAGVCGRARAIRPPPRARSCVVHVDLESGCRAGAAGAAPCASGWPLGVRADDQWGGRSGRAHKSLRFVDEESRAALWWQPAEMASILRARSEADRLAAQSPSEGSTCYDGISLARWQARRRKVFRVVCAQAIVDPEGLARVAQEASAEDRACALLRAAEHREGALP